MKIHYYPGCTLKEKTTALDLSTREAMLRLDVELVEPEGWSCCGAEYPLTEEKIIGLAAPARVMRQVRDEGGDVLITTCSFCYAVLKRTNYALKNDALKHKRINAFLKDDIKINPLTKEKTTGFEDYNGEVKVLHLLEYLRDYVGPPKIKSRLKRPFPGLKIAPYYGCRLLRPQKELGLDEPDNPHIFEEFLELMGCAAVDYPFKQECCGSYLSVSLPEAATEASYRILRAARMDGAQAVAVTCPLCFYNMDKRQDAIRESFLDFAGLPVLFFTQILAWALGVDKSALGLAEHAVPAAHLFEDKPRAEVTL
ncbi:MAG: CoB--CoM heterodisulfide reductase iron-sulfur subunit B family protein [Candidatus Aminicenantes bacterium]|nr:CoB--CoM heterodisulfide reductase iron-sulfur subunit B family protein [Candidatus Aminicenantes bacterium]